LKQDTLDITGADYEYNLIVYLANRLFYSCAVKGCNTGLQHNFPECVITRLY